MRQSIRKLPPDAAAVCDRYLDIVDTLLPGHISGFYVSGSIALDDYQPGRSDVDFVALSPVPLDTLAVERLAKIHSEFRRRGLPSLDGFYLTESLLAQPPLGLHLPSSCGGKFRNNDSYEANPVAWEMLKNHAIALRGPEIGRGLEVYSNAEGLRSWCERNVASYWKDWVRSLSNNPMRAIYSLTAPAVSWGVLGLSRIHATIREGTIISKSAAAHYAKPRFDTCWHGIIDEAQAIREGTQTGFYRSAFKRRAEALAFMNCVIQSL